MKRIEIIRTSVCSIIRIGVSVYRPGAVEGARAGAGILQRHARMIKPDAAGGRANIGSGSGILLGRPPNMGIGPVDPQIGAGGKAAVFAVPGLAVCSRRSVCYNDGVIIGRYTGSRH